MQANTLFVPLPNNATTNILTCAPITGLAGSFFQFTGMVNFTCLGNSTNDAPTAIVILKEDGAALASSFVTPGAHARAGVFDFLACIPIAWWLVTDGLPHVYTVDVNTDSYSDCGKQVQTCALFVNNFPA